MKTLEQILKGMSAHLNGDTELPTGDEYDLWVESINQTQDQWADVDFDWDSLRKSSVVTLMQSGTSVALPSDYVKLDGYTLIGGNEYGEIRPEEVNLHTSDNYVIPYTGEKYLAIYPASASTVDVRINYYGRPQSMTTLTSQSLCPSDNFLIYGAVEKIFLQRENQKFTEFQNRAENELSKMIGKQVVKLDQFDSSIKNEITYKRGFTLGVD